MCGMDDCIGAEAHAQMPSWFEMAKEWKKEDKAKEDAEQDAQFLKSIGISGAI